MKIVCLVPFISQIVSYFELEDSVVGISHLCDLENKKLNPQRLTKPSNRIINFSASLASSSAKEVLENHLSPYQLDFSLLKSLDPDIVLTSALIDDKECTLSMLKELLRRELRPTVKLYSYNPTTLDQIYEMYQQIGNVLEAPRQGVELAGRIKAQFMDWADNFYDRTRGKKVSFINALEPDKKNSITLAGLWIPDMIHLTSAVSQHRYAGQADQKINWDHILQFAPDVIIVAPSACNLKESIASLKYFESLPDWEMLPAVKRGEVIFCDGSVYFNSPGPKILDSMGILTSAIAGLESGYISDRDSFQRLRWVEPHRHKFK